MKLFQPDGRNAPADRPVNRFYIFVKINCKNHSVSYVAGMHYYLNIYTKESQWDLPKSPAQNNSSSGLDQVQCAHLLVKHKGSRRPSSWREENITRTKEEARDILEGYYKKVKIAIEAMAWKKTLGQYFFISTRSNRAKPHWNNWPRNTPTAVQLNVVAIWVHLVVAPCRNLSKMLHSIWKSANCPTSLRPNRDSISLSELSERRLSHFLMPFGIWLQIKNWILIRVNKILNTLSFRLRLEMVSIHFTSISIKNAFSWIFSSFFI